MTGSSRTSFTFPILVSQLLGYFPSKAAPNLSTGNFVNHHHLPKFFSVSWVLFTITTGVTFIIQRIVNKDSTKSHPCFKNLYRDDFFYDSMTGWVLLQSIFQAGIRIDSLLNCTNITSLWTELDKLLPIHQDDSLFHTQCIKLKFAWIKRLILNVSISTFAYLGIVYINVETISSCPIEAIFDRLCNISVSLITCAQFFSLHAVELYLQILNISISHRVSEMTKRFVTQNINIKLIISSSYSLEDKVREDFNYIMKLQNLIRNFNTILNRRLTLETLNFIGMGSIMAYSLTTNIILMNNGPTSFSFIVLLILIHSFYKFCEVSSNLTNNCEDLVLISIDFFECSDFLVSNFLLPACNKKFTFLVDLFRSQANCFTFCHGEIKFIQSFSTSTVNSYLRYLIFYKRPTFHSTQTISLIVFLFHCLDFCSSNNLPHRIDSIQFFVIN